MSMASFILEAVSHCLFQMGPAPNGSAPEGKRGSVQGTGSVQRAALDYRRLSMSRFSANGFLGGEAGWVAGAEAVSEDDAEAKRPPLMIGGDAAPFAEPPVLHSPPLYLDVTQVLGPKPSHSWQAEWVGMSLEQAVLDREGEFALASRFKAGGEDSIRATVELHQDEISWKVDAGWDFPQAAAHTLISLSGVSAVERALHEHDPAYAASTHALCEALHARAFHIRPFEAQRGDGDSVEVCEVAPFAFCNLHGKFGLAVQDAIWKQHLHQDARVGDSFNTYDLVCATSTPKTFQDAQGYGVPVMRGGQLVFETQPGAVVCVVSRPTKILTTAERIEIKRAQPKGSSLHSRIFATGHSLIRSSASSYDLPPLATVTLEARVPKGEWRAFGLTMSQDLYVVGVSYPIDREFFEHHAKKALATNHVLQRRKPNVKRRCLQVRQLIHLLTMDPELDGFVDEINMWHTRYKRQEIPRKEMLQEIGKLVGRGRIIHIMENY